MQLEVVLPENLPWYFKNGTIRPKPGQINAIWPKDDPGDRILNQLMYVPMEKPKILKKIFLDKDIDYLYHYRARPGRKIFEKLKCPVKDCIIVNNKLEADAVVYRNHISDKRDSSIPPNQVIKKNKLIKNIHNSCL